MENISLGQAFAYAFTLTSYWVWLVIGLVVVAIGFYTLKKNYDRTQEWTLFKGFIAFALVCILAAAIFAAPTSIAANTTKEQAARGVYIR